MNKVLETRLIALALIFAVQFANAETIEIPLSEHIANNQSSGLTLPAKGLTQSLVMQHFGEPLEEVDAVGTPPISIWHYSAFSVYFESDRVIHAVASR